MKILGPGWLEVERYTLKCPSEGMGGAGWKPTYMHTHIWKKAEQTAVYSPDLPLIF